jgi:hypothetical protein
MKKEKHLNMSIMTIVLLFCLSGLSHAQINMYNEIPSGWNKTATYSPIDGNSSNSR